MNHARLDADARINRREGCRFEIDGTGGGESHENDFSLQALEEFLGEFVVFIQEFIKRDRSKWRSAAPPQPISIPCLRRVTRSRSVSPVVVCFYFKTFQASPESCSICKPVLARSTM